MISINFQQIKKEKFRCFSTHFSTTKNGKGTDMILFNFTENAVIFKTSYIYQSTNVCSEIPFSKNLYQIETSQLIICNKNQWTGF